MIPNKFRLASLLAGVVALLAACDDTPVASSSQRQAPMPDPQSPGAVLLTKFCSDCHAPPHTQTHIAREWPNVIYRMQEHRRMKGLHLLSEDELTTLLTYLQQHAKGT